MTTIGELYSNLADKLARNHLGIGDVHYLHMGRENGITPKKGDSKNKYFIILGFNSVGELIGGVVINSTINHKLPTDVTDYMFSVSVKQLPFLRYDSIVNCSKLKTIQKNKFSSRTYIGTVNDKELLRQIIATVKESPLTTLQELKEFNL